MGGGNGNIASNQWATVSGGFHNSATGSSDATVAGGHTNTASGLAGTVGGGITNTASGDYTTIPGGIFNIALGHYSFAAGRRAKANHDGAFVWGDSTDADVASSAVNQFIARASGGATFYTDTGLTTGVTVAAGGGSWSSVSDRNLKENFADVSGNELLGKLDDVPMQTWNYKTQEPSIRHMGPMAQDFRAAFGLGDDDKHIATVDADGVALAGVQALYRMVLEKDSQIEQLTDQVRQLRSAIEALQTRLGVEVSEASRGE